VLCCRRYDLASPTRELLAKSISLQAGTICVLFYFCGLLVSLIMAQLDERIGLFDAGELSNTTVKVKVSTLDIAPLRGTPPQKRSV